MFTKRVLPALFILFVVFALGIFIFQDRNFQWSVIEPIYQKHCGVGPPPGSVYNPDGLAFRELVGRLDPVHVTEDGFIFIVPCMLGAYQGNSMAVFYDGLVYQPLSFIFFDQDGERYSSFIASELEYRKSRDIFFSGARMGGQSSCGYVAEYKFVEGEMILQTFEAKWEFCDDFEKEYEVIFDIKQSVDSSDEPFIIDATREGPRGRYENPDYSLISKDVPHFVESIFYSEDKISRWASYDGKYIKENKDVLLVENPWLSDPEIVARNYLPLFGFSSNIVYENGSSVPSGERGFGLYAIRFFDVENSNREYRISLNSSFSNEPSLWIVGSVTDVEKEKEEESRLRPFFAYMPFDRYATNTIDLPYGSVSKYLYDGTTQKFLNVLYPYIGVSLTTRAATSSVSSSTVLVYSEGRMLPGVQAKYLEELTYSHEESFIMEIIEIDLTNVPNLRDLSFSNIEVVLTDGITDVAGRSMFPCKPSDHFGFCGDAKYGGIYSFPVRIYHPEDILDLVEAEKDF